MFPPAGAGARARGWLLCHRASRAALVKLDKWIRGAQIWAGIFEKKTTEMLKGSGGWKRRVKGIGRGKDICVVGATRGRVACKNGLLLPKKTRQ